MPSQAVTVDNFVRAETDTYFANLAAAAGVGRLYHVRLPVPLDQQTVVRMNFDTLYSYVVFDLESPVTITLPDAERRFLSLMAVNQDHYTKLVAYEPGAYTITQEVMGTRYAAVIFRTFVDPASSQDIAAANQVQDRIGLTQASVGTLELGDWDKESLVACRAAISALSPFVPDNTRMFGDEHEVSPVRHLYGTAIGWGGNREEDATYLLVTPEQNDGATAYVLNVKDVPVRAFWSVSVYNEKGFFETDPQGVYSLNSVTAKPNADGSFTLHFGGDRSARNRLDIVNGWNYTVRLYRPQPEILGGRWQFPSAVPVGSTA
jgi:hypothetical protein